MSYPKELHEITRLEEKNLPFQLFLNGSEQAVPGQNILYLHWHEHFEIIVMQRGEAIFHIDSVPYEVSAGDVLLVPAGGLHVGYCSSGGEIRYAAIVFNASLFKDWAQDPVHMKYVAPYLENRFRFPVQLDTQLPALAGFDRLLDQIITEYAVKGPAYQLIVKTELYLLFAQLSRHHWQQNAANAPVKDHSLNRERFKPLLAYIEEHYAEAMTIEQAAQRVSLNPYHFCKTFKKLTGRTFIEYVNDCRVSEAARLLQQGDLSITEIAGLVGCDNPNYFTKLFKQYKGLTPRQYRKQS
ncbi:helix-turn-helix transcriptional regulator [Paenibacillus gorillae]|uniref:helix-turn-helix transcriptional regulator n=1 Tax=Paenibacillus gorillae TaxID=1243662 RepID=UPI0004AEDAFB|nr:AraC family transcriptional regulator [Paenibacillus gorillae]